MSKNESGEERVKKRKGGEGGEKRGGERGGEEGGEEGELGGGGWGGWGGWGGERSMSVCDLNVYGFVHVTMDTTSIVCVCVCLCACAKTEAYTYVGLLGSVGQWKGRCRNPDLENSFFSPGQETPAL